MDLLKIAAAPLEILLAVLDYIYFPPAVLYTHNLCFFLACADFYFYTFCSRLYFFSLEPKSLPISLKSELKHNSVFDLYLIYS